MTTTRITREVYDAACAAAPVIKRQSARYKEAGRVARAAVGNDCPRCGKAFTDENPPEFCHYAPTPDGERVTSDGVWLGSTACRECNMVDEAFRRIIGLTATEPLPFDYVADQFHVPATFATRAELASMASVIPDTRPTVTSDAVVSRAVALVNRYRP